MAPRPAGPSLVTFSSISSFPSPWPCSCALYIRPCLVTHIGALKCALIAYLCCDKLLQSPSEKPTGCRCEPMANSDRPTIIEKYANRRLYHTGTYTLVTLDDLAAMVRRRKDFLVCDAKTGADITRSVLAQIVFEQENSHGA